MEVQLDQLGVLEKRRKYGLLDLLGDMGGVLEVIVLGFGFFIFPISEFSYLIEAAQSLFYARTFRHDMFKKD